MSGVELENRMRALEPFRGLVVESGGWCVLRLDGCGFHRFTETRFDKPFDERFRDLMVATARRLMETFHALYAYTMSDEISLLMPSDWGVYGRRVEKTVSVTAGLASAAFTNACGEIAHFDSRVWHGRTVTDVIDYFGWRQADAARNAMHSCCYWTLRRSGRSAEQATALLDGKGVRAQRRLLAAHGIDPDKLAAWQLHGVGLYWEPYEKTGVDPRDGAEALVQRHRIHVDAELPTGRAYARMLRRIARQDLTGPHAPVARRILHVDMDAFFAAIEQKRHPELRGQPVIVGGKGDPDSRAVVSAASYEARRFGVRSGMPLRQAYRRCPEAVFLPVDFDTYAAKSDQVMAVLRGVSSRVETAGLDEAYLDVTYADEPAEAIAREIKARVLAATGLTCSIGVAPNKLLAKIASDMDKPDGLTVVGHEDLEDRIWPLPVRRIPGIGPKTEARLEQSAIASIGDLAARSREDLIAQFGPAHGAYFFEAARGVDNSDVVTHHVRKSIGRETTFETDLADPVVIRRRVARLMDEVALDARARGMRARTVIVKLRYANFKTVTRRTTLPRATINKKTLRRAAFDCLERIAFDRKVRLVGVRLGGLERSGPASS